MILPEALKFHSYMLKLLCLLPLNIKCVKATTSYDSLTIIPSIGSSIILIIAISIYDVFHISTNLWRPEVGTDILTIILNTFSKFASAFVLTFIMLLRIIRQRSLSNFFAILLKFDRNFYLMTRNEINNYNWIRNFVLTISVGIGIIGYTEWSNCLMFVNDAPAIDNRELCMTMCYIPIILIFSGELQYLSYVLLIKMRYGAVRVEIEKLGKGSWNIVLLNKNVINLGKLYDNDTIKLKKLVEMYQELNSAMKLINSTFSLQNLVVLLFQFVTLVILIYNFCIDFTRYFASIFFINKFFEESNLDPVCSTSE